MVLKKKWKKKEKHVKLSLVKEVHTLEGDMTSPLDEWFIFPTRASAGNSLSRSGYELAENLQNGAVSPIFSRLKAIYMWNQILDHHHNRQTWCQARKFLFHLSSSFIWIVIMRVTWWHAGSCMQNIWWNGNKSW